MTAYNESLNYNAAINYNGGASPAPITGGHFLPAQHGKHKRTLSNVQVIYDQAKSLSRKETKELRDAISEFVEPAIARQTTVPDLFKVDYEALKANEAAYEKFSQALSNIQQHIEIVEKNHRAALARQQAEDDELLLMATISCLIH